MVNAAVENLIKFKRKAQIVRVQDFDAWPKDLADEPQGSKFSEIVDHLTGAITETGIWLRCLAELVENFAPFVQANLACIGSVLELDMVTRKMKVPTERLGDEGPGTEDPPPSSSLAGSELGNITETGSTEVSTEEKFSNLQIKDRDDNYIEFRTLIDGKRWHQASFEWLRLLCMQTYAYNTLSCDVVPHAYDKAIKQVVDSAQLNVFRSHSQYAENPLYIKEYLETYTYFNKGEPAKFDKDEQKHIYNWLKKHGRGFPKDGKALLASAERNQGAGTVHCETAGMCLYLIDTHREKLVDPDVHDPDIDSPSFHLKLPPVQVTEMMRDTFDVLSVTKRCCPACHALVMYLIETGGYKPDMLYAGAHSDWSQVCLPSFMPKAAGEAVVAAAQKALTPRLKQMIADEEKAISPETVKSWGSHMTSTISKPGATDSSPLPLPVVPTSSEPQGMEDSANPDFVWPESSKRERPVSSPTSSPTVKKMKAQKTGAASGPSTQPETGESSKGRSGEGEMK